MERVGYIFGNPEGWVFAAEALLFDWNGTDIGFFAPTERPFTKKSTDTTGDWLVSWFGERTATCAKTPTVSPQPKPGEASPGPEDAMVSTSFEDVTICPEL